MRLPIVAFTFFVFVLLSACGGSDADSVPAQAQTPSMAAASASATGEVASVTLPASTPTPAPASVLPAKVVGGYWPYWPEAPIRIRDIPAAYNVVYLFSAIPVGGAPGTTGAVYWSAPGDGRGAATHFAADIQYARTVQRRKIILSVGGAGHGMSFPNRAHSQAFVDSVVALYDRWGGFDGMDWNTYEADQQPSTSEMIWISLELKRRYPGFLITTPPAPWSQRDMAFCQAMAQAGALDYAAPQYYDGPGLNEPSYVVGNVAQWVGLLGESRVVVGMGLWNAANYMSVAQAGSAWTQLKSRYPQLRGAFNWSIALDEGGGWPFATRIAPQVTSP